MVERMKACRMVALWFVKKMNAKKVREEYINALQKYDQGSGKHLLSMSVRQKIHAMYERPSSLRHGWTWSWMKEGLFLYNFMNARHTYGLAKKSICMEVFGNISKYIHNAFDRETYRKENGLWYDKQVLEDAKKKMQAEEAKKKVQLEQQSEQQQQQQQVQDVDEDDDVMVVDDDNDNDDMMKDGDNEILREKKAKLDEEIARCLQMQEEKEEMEDGDYEP